MPLKLKVGLSREVGLAQKGSLGVFCHNQVEIDVAALRDVEDLDRTVREAYSVCRHAVDGELHRRGEAVNLCVSPSRDGSACRCGSWPERSLSAWPLWAIGLPAVVNALA